MARKPKPDDAPLDLDAELTISTEKVCFIIVKAREFDVKDAVTEPDPGSNAADDGQVAVLEDHADDPVQQELTSFINALTGRDDYEASDWATVRDEAAREHNRRTASYLLGMPMLADFLEEGLSMLGRSCDEFEANHL
jgi:hypothetical protein